MVRLAKCKLCDKFLSTVQDISPYGSHGWKFHCCGIEYYKCKRETCTHKQCHKLYYQDTHHLNEHIKKYHITHKEKEQIPSLLLSSKSSHSYESTSALGRYFNEHASHSNTFPPSLQRSAIKNIITTACTKKTGVLSLSESISDQSFAIFFAIAQITFLSNDAVLKYLSILLSLVIPLWKKAFNCKLDIPTTSEEIKSIITSTKRYSIRNLIPMPHLEDVQDHCYTSIQSLLAYTAMTCSTNSKASKPRYISWMQSKSCQKFCDKIRNLPVHGRRPAVAVFMVFWSDGFDPTTSMKRNRRSVWIMTVTFFFFDITTEKLYMVESCLLALGPGKSFQDSKEEHSCIFEKLRADLDQVIDPDNEAPIPSKFVSRAHHGVLCDFYLCTESYFTQSNITVDSNSYIMDNPERRTNFGLLGGNSNNHAYFGLSCNFSKLRLPFEACSLCQTEINNYCSERGWMNQPAPAPQCNECHGFSIDHLLQEGEYLEPIYIPDGTINKSTLPGNHLFEKPGRLTNTLLIGAYNKARDLFLEGVMAEKEVRSYLSTLCFNNKTISDLLEQCRTYQLSIDIQNKSSDITNDDRLEVLLAEQQSPEEVIKIPSPPPMLYLCNIDCAVETMMHLGMNASKHCEQASFLWAKDIPNLSCADMIANVQKYIKAIDHLKLADFPVMQFKTDSMGGYVAENHRAYMQIAPWSFRWIHAYEDKRKDDWLKSLNINLLDTWSKKEMLSWLSVRGVTINRKMLKKELMLKVKESKDLPEIQEFQPFSGKDMREMILTLNSFLSALFATDLEGKKAVHRLNSLARQYLSLSARLDQYLMLKKPSWITTFSLLGMLRIPKTFEIVPYPICFYEGDDMGEKTCDPSYSQV